MTKTPPLGPFVDTPLSLCTSKVTCKRTVNHLQHFSVYYIHPHAKTLTGLVCTVDSSSNLTVAEVMTLMMSSHVWPKKTVTVHMLAPCVNTADRRNNTFKILHKHTHLQPGLHTSFLRPLSSGLVLTYRFTHPKNKNYTLKKMTESCNKWESRDQQAMIDL